MKPCILPWINFGTNTFGKPRVCGYSSKTSDKWDFNSKYFKNSKQTDTTNMNSMCDIGLFAIDTCNRDNEEIIKNFIDFNGLNAAWKEDVWKTDYQAAIGVSLQDEDDDGFIHDSEGC